jgi:NADH dehydrogenase
MVLKKALQLLGALFSILLSSMRPRPEMPFMRRLSPTPHVRAIKPRKRLVVLGAGFAGLYTARKLAHQLRDEDNVDLVLINDENYFLYTPMLTEVAAGTIEARHILAPLRALCQTCNFIRARVEAIDLTQKALQLNLGDGQQPYPLSYDYLVITLGSQVNKTIVPGATEFALALKEVSDALMIRNRVIEMFERANVESVPSHRAEMLTFTIAGGGFSGVEIAGAIQNLCYEIQPFYPNIDREEVRVVVVEGRDRILMELPEDVACYAQSVIQEEENIELRLGTLLAEVTAQSARLSDGTVIPTRTVVWTTGVSIEPLIACLPFEKDQRCRILVNEYLEVGGTEGVWSLGDCALIPDLENPGGFMGPTAQNAIREADVAARNILATLRNQPERRRPFRYRPVGEFVILGHHNAVATLKGLRLRGYLAWWLWRLFYALKLPSRAKRFQVLTDWGLDVFTRRDTTQIKMVPSRLHTVQPEEAPHEFKAELETRAAS